jgi:hypothetical protein
MRTLTSFVALLTFTACGCAHGPDTSGASTTPPPSASFAELARLDDEAGFTESARSELAALLAGHQVVVTEARTLFVDERFAISLDRPYAGCQQDPSTCDDFTREFLEGVAQQLSRSEDEARPTAERLRLALRPRERLSMSAGGTSVPVAQQFIGDVYAVVMVDFPESARVLLESELEGLGMDRAAAIERARANVVAELGPFAPENLPPRGAPMLGVISGRYYYESSRLFDPESFEAISQRLGGALLVAVPAYDTVLFAEGTDETAAAAFAAITENVYRDTTQPLSTQVFRYRSGRLVPISAPRP